MYKRQILTYAKKLGLGIGIVGLYNIQFIVDKSDHVYICLLYTSRAAALTTEHTIHAKESMIGRLKNHG